MSSVHRSRRDRYHPPRSAGVLVRARPNHCILVPHHTLAYTCAMTPEPDANHFLQEDPWRIFRIMAEFVDSFETMSRVGPAVSIFGSARMKPSHPYYKKTVHLAEHLAALPEGRQRIVPVGATLAAP